MIEKFNFYDVYGYFLPGAAFLAILWTPFGLVKGVWPSSDWSSAVIAAALAYILGHLIQSIATNAIPSWEVKGLAARNRYPSEIYLDPADSELPGPAKAKIAALIKTQFDLDLQVDKPGDAAIDKVRNNAFLFARQILIQGKAASYAEQFQGMYALTRGLVSVFALGCAYWLGWAAGAVRNRLLAGTAVVIIAVTVLVLLNISLALSGKISDPVTKRKVELGYAAFLLLTCFAVGYVLGVRYHIGLRVSVLLAFLAVWALIVCLRGSGAYKFFAGHFASTVWRDYLAYHVKPAGNPSPD